MIHLCWHTCRFTMQVSTSWCLLLGRMRPGVGCTRLLQQQKKVSSKTHPTSKWRQALRALLSTGLTTLQLLQLPWALIIQCYSCLHQTGVIHTCGSEFLLSGPLTWWLGMYIAGHWVDNTVEPLYNGHHYDPAVCPLFPKFRGSFLLAICGADSMQHHFIR